MRTLGMAMTVGLITFGFGCGSDTSIKVKDAGSSDAKRDSGAAGADSAPSGADTAPSGADASRDSNPTADTSIADAGRDTGSDLRGVDSGATGNGRSVGSLGQCANANCAGAAEFSACMTGTCDSDLRTCFGPDYANGNFSGACAAYMTCIWQCPCDATAKTCEAQCAPLLASGSCLGCLTSACMISACGAPPACILPAATPVDGGSTSGVDGGTVAGCAKALSCCALVEAAMPSLGPACRAAVTGKTDAQCDALIAGYASLCP